MKTCIFCKIVKKEIETHKVYENKYAFVFMDKHPINPGHLLVIPKDHVTSFYDMDEKLFLEVMKVVKRMGKIINIKLKPKKVGVISAGWDIQHTHFHLIPMKDYHDITSQQYIKSKIRFKEFKEMANPTEKVLEKIAKKLKSSK